MRFKVLLLIIAMVLVSVSVQAITVAESYSGLVPVITNCDLEIPTCIIKHNLIYKSDLNGLIDLNGLGTVGFGLKGIILGSNYFFRSWETNWNRQVLEKNDFNTVILKKTNYQNLDWNQYWYFELNKPVKFLHSITNRTGKTINNAEYLYIFTFDENSLDKIIFRDGNSIIQHSPNDAFIWNSYPSAEEMDFEFMISNKLLLNFDDLIAEDFNFSTFFIGNLNDYDIDLPMNYGLVIGVSRGDKKILNNETVLLEPIIQDNFTGEGGIPPNTNNWEVLNVAGTAPSAYVNITSNKLNICANNGAGQGSAGLRMRDGAGLDYDINFLSLNYIGASLTVVSGSQFFFIIGQDNNTSCLNQYNYYSAAGIYDANSFVVEMGAADLSFHMGKGHTYYTIPDMGGAYPHTLNFDINKIGVSTDFNISFKVDGIIRFSTVLSNIGVGWESRRLWMCKNWRVPEITLVDDFVYTDSNLSMPTVDSNFSFDKNQLDAENGKNSVNWSFKNTTTYFLSSPTAYYWHETFGGVDLNVGTDENLMRTYTTVGNRIICLNTFAVGDVNSLVCQDANVSSLPQDVNFTWNPYIATKNVDMNFYGQGTLPITDWFWQYDGTYFGNDRNKTYAFTVGGDKNVCLTAQNIDLNKQKCYTVQVYGNMAIQFVDENTGAGVKPYYFTINGTNYAYAIDANGLLDVNLAIFPKGIYVLKAWDVNFGSREWDLNLTGANVDYNFAFLQLAKGQTVNFRMFDENGIVLSDRYVNLYISGSKLAGRVKTDSSGNCSFFLNGNDENYTYTIEMPTETLIFNPLTVSVAVPKDEVNTSLELQPFNLSISGIGARVWAGLTTTKTLKILPNTSDKYVFNIDRNAEYYARNYSIGVPGRAPTYSLQPYLVPLASGILSWFYAYDYSGISFPNLLIVIKKNIPGIGLTTVESRITDGTGSANFSFVSLESYTAEFYYNGVLLFSNDITANSTSYYVYVNVEGILSGYIGNQPGSSSLQVDFFPKGGIIIYPHNPVSISELIKNFNAGVYIVSNGINIHIEQDGNVLYDANFGSVGTYTQTFTRPQINAAKPLEVRIIITTTAGVFVFRNFGFVIFIGEEPYNIWGLLSNAKTQSLGDFGALLIAFFISIFVVGGLSNVFRDTNALGIIFCLVLSVFVVIGWVNVFIFGMICSFAAVLILLNNRVASS